MSLLVGALVLRLKQTGAILNALQMSFGLLMGVWTQVSLFPAAVRIVSYMLPMTWINSGIRASIMGIPYLTGSLALDLSALVVLSVIMPLLGAITFRHVEKGVKENGGVGAF
jgi:ABC-type multidrug transport system permease subunit